MAMLHTAPARGLTIIELMVVLALLGVLVALVAPSMRGLISAQRVRGVNAELVTDMQYARSEAARRNRDVRVGFQTSDTLSCYVAYVEPESPPTPPVPNGMGGISGCDCTRTPGQDVCSGGREEVKTVQVLRSAGVTFDVTSGGGSVIGFSRLSGALVAVMPGIAQPTPIEVLVTGTPRGQLRTAVNAAGRSSVCSPDASISGVSPCP